MGGTTSPPTYTPPPPRPTPYTPPTFGMPKRDDSSGGGEGSGS
jgi:hypothetical protein